MTTRDLASNTPTAAVATCAPNLGRQARRQRRLVGLFGLATSAAVAVWSIASGWEPFAALLLLPMVAGSWLAVLQARTGT